METAAKQPEITWKTVTRKVGELAEWEENPRVITEFAFNQLVESLQQDGYHNRIMITQDNLIIGGHQRKRALLASGLSNDTEIEVIQANEPLTAEQFARLNVRDNLGYGQFDFDKLANMYTPIQLIEWHMPQSELPTMSEESEVELKDHSASVGKDGHKIIIECNTEREQQALYERLCAEGLECRLL